MEKQEVSKRVQVYLPEELANRVEQLAKAEHMTISSCCTVMIGDAMQEMLENNPSVVDVTDGDSEDSVHIRLYGKDAALLKKKAAKLHLNPTAWVRNAVLRKDLTIHRIEFGDLREMSAIYGRLVSSIEGIVAVCRDTYNVFPQDVERIIDLMETIRDQHIIVMICTWEKKGGKEKTRQKRIVVMRVFIKDITPDFVYKNRNIGDAEISVSFETGILSGHKYSAHLTSVSVSCIIILCNNMYYL